MIEGSDVPNICVKCPDSYWEEMSGGYEEAYCGRYMCSCDESLKQCDRIAYLFCNECPRHTG